MLHIVSVNKPSDKKNKKWNSWFIFIASFHCRGQVNIHVDAAACAMTTEAEFSQSQVPQIHCVFACLGHGSSRSSSRGSSYVLQVHQRAESRPCPPERKRSPCNEQLEQTGWKEWSRDHKEEPGWPQGSCSAGAPLGVSDHNQSQEPRPTQLVQSRATVILPTAAHLHIYRDALLRRIRTWTWNALGDNGLKIDLVPLSHLQTLPHFYCCCSRK